MSTQTKILSALLIALGACSGSDERSLDLLPPEPAEDPSDAERVARMNITVSVNGVDTVYTARKLAMNVVAAECIALLRVGPDGNPAGLPFTGTFPDANCNSVGALVGDAPTSGPPAFQQTTAQQQASQDNCTLAVCRMNQSTCVANRLLEISEAAAPVTLVVSQTTHVIPPPDEETSIALAEEAFHYSAWATTLAGDNLRKVAGRTTYAAPCAAAYVTKSMKTSDSTLTITYGENLANTLSDGANLGTEAAERAMQHHVNVADAERSRTRDVVLAAKRAWIDKNMSRARAAHVLLGGALESGLADVTAGVCPLRTPDNGVRDAMDTLRSSGLAPAAVKSSTAVGSMWIAAASGDTVAIRDRLAALTGDAAIASMSWDEYLASTGLTDGEFEQARQYLTEEIKTFGRDETIQLTSKSTAATMVNGVLVPHTTTTPIFAATATQPRQKPAIALMAQARSGGLPENCSTAPCTNTWAQLNDADVAGTTVPGPSYARKGAAQLRDYADAVFFDLANVSLPTDVSARVREAESANGTGGGRVEACYSYDTTNKHVVRLRFFTDDGYRSRSQYGVFSGLSRLRCAVDGAVEGVPCTLQPESGSLTAGGGTDGQAGVRYYGQLTLSNLSLPASGPLWLFVARLRDGASATPGNYDPVAGFRVVVDKTGTSDTNFRYCTWMPVGEALNAKTLGVLGVAPGDCTQPENLCSGVGYATEIPLENELSSNGDPYESSWRVYLERARAAAAEADQLGEALIQQGLDLDSRVEAAEKEIEELCGVPVSFSSYFPGVTTVYQGTCSTANDGAACGTSGKCRNGVCLMDPLTEMAARATTDATAAAVADCLGTSSVMSLVAVGKDPFCVWQNNTTNAVCEKQGDLPCPYPQVDGNCVTPAGLGAGLTVRPVTTTLGLLQDERDRLGRSIDCAALAGLRGATSNREEVVAALAPWMTTAKMADIARRVGWEARPGDFSAVTLDGMDIFSTGNPLLGTCATPGTSTVWPCTAPFQQAGLFSERLVEGGCSVLDPDTARDARQAWNTRLGEATIALKVLAGTDIGPEIIQPYRSLYANQVRDVPAGRNVGCLGGGLLQSHAGTLQYIDCFAGAGLCGVGCEQGSYYTCSLAGAPAGTTYCQTIENELWMGVSYDCALGATAVPVSFWTAAMPAANRPHDIERVWGGLGGLAALARDGDASPELDNLVRRIVTTPGEDTDVVVTPAAGALLSTYWQKNDVTNYFELAPNGLTQGALLDALELACAVDQEWYSKDCNESAPPPIAYGISDLSDAQRYLGCMGEKVMQEARYTVLRDVPADVVEALQGRTDVNGSLGAAATDLAAALVALDAQKLTIARELSGLGYDLGTLRRQIKRVKNQQAQLKISQSLESLNMAASCFGGMVGSATNGGKGAGGTIASCLLGSVTNELRAKLSDLSEENLELDSEQSWAQVREQILARATTLKEAGAAADVAILKIQSSLAQIRNLRATGQRSLASAMLVGGTGGEHTFALNTSMRRRYNTLQLRYQRALEKARRAAWLARRAVEQRLAVSLAELHDPMLLVDAPAQWADDLCTLEGLNYAAIRDESGLVVDDYADQYIGDYVDRLERVVESYEHDFPFSDAADTATISIRDDVLNVRENCAVSVPNLLAYSGFLNVAADPSDTSETPEAIWVAANCAEPACPVAAPLDGNTYQELVSLSPRPAQRMVGYEVSFCRGGANCADGAELHQVVNGGATMPAGYYRLSWYSPRTNWPTAVPPEVDVDLRLATGGAVERSQTVGKITEMGWNRFYRIYRLPSAQALKVVLAARPNLGENEEYFAAIMLEDMSGEIAGRSTTADVITPTSYPPAPYVDTTLSGTGTGSCEDGDGSTFRGTGWERGCEKLCPTGFGNCEDGEVHCYRETELLLTVDGIESGGALAHSGFAYGNFNYRIDWLAVNLVGTGIKDCSSSPTPSTCYASQNIPYTLVHKGPFEVRNYEGDIYDAPLFDGRIEHGRGLAAERYVTNPISSADMSMLQPYSHTELRGRPLTGTYTLRLWDTDGVQWNALEDVQIILGYRYWTRFE